MAFFDDWDWNKISQAFGQAVVPAVTSIIGGNQVAKANANAANIMQQNAAANKAVIANANAPALEYLSTVTARDPNQLTPQQVQQMQDAQRTMVQSTPTGLRGSGRFMTAAVNDVQNRMKQGMITTNTARADTANTQRGALAGGVANQMVAQDTGAAQVGANAGTATAGSNNASLMNIGSYFANAMKGVNSPYGTTPATPYGNYGMPVASAYPQPRSNERLVVGGA